jgi:tetratricopeptide (TPR) repeat protein
VHNIYKKNELFIVISCTKEIILKQKIYNLLYLFLALIFIGIQVPSYGQKINTDSLKKVTQKRNDSLSALRSYKESKRYKDSVEIERQIKIENRKIALKKQNDSLNAIRKQVSDSISAARQRYSDSIKKHNDSVRIAQKLLIEQRKLEQQRRIDSMATLRAYKASKGYKDSVAAASEARRAAAAKERKQVSDSLKSIQKRNTDSLITIRKATNDSLKTILEKERAERMRILDSTKQVRAIRSDSLAKVREARAALRKQKGEEKEKKQKDKAKIALEIKIKKKQDAYSNEDLRKKKWNLPRKLIQNTTTRYNYYFNANKKMEEAVFNMVRSRVDNYDSLIPLFPFNPDIDAGKLKSDMDTIIGKASVGIQIHDPRAKWQDDLYLLVGQAFYYKADYENAGSTFKFIISESERAKKEKAKKSAKSSKDKKPVTFNDAEKKGIAGMLEHRTAVNESMLWIARTLTQSKKEGQAQTLLDMMRNDANFPERLKGRLAIEQANIELSRGDQSAAVKSLAEASKDSELPKWLRLRTNFLAGQITQEQDPNTSNQFFAEVLDLNPNLEMEFYARRAIAFNSLDASNKNTGQAIVILQKMSKDEKFRPYYDQVYYALGKAMQNQEHLDSAISFYKQSVKHSKGNNKQKGLSFVALGDRYYDKLEYALAKSSYDSAAILLNANIGEAFTKSQQRSQTLSNIAVPSNEAKALDSLLKLAALPEKEQLSVVRDYIKRLERLQRDSAFMSQNSSNVPANFMPNSQAGAWYFANPTMMKQGENEFKQKWGDRPLKDNWRRSGASSSAFSEDEENNHASDNNTNNLHSEDLLMAAIPKSPAVIDSIKLKHQEALFNLGKGYYNFLEDYNRAMATFDSLDTRYPNHPYKAEELYTKYLIEMRRNNTSAAQTYLNTLRNQYPDSEWAILLKGTESTATKPGTQQDALSQYYDETYAQLNAKQYDEVLKRISIADEQYKNQGNFRKRFDLIKAVATAGVGQYHKADTMLNMFIAATNDEELKALAQAALAYIKKIAPPIPTAVNHDSTATTQNTTPVTMPNIANSNSEPSNTVNTNLPNTNTTNTPNTPIVPSNAAYTYKPNTTHYVMIEAKPDAKFSGLRAGLSDYNMMTPNKSNITVTTTSFDANSGVIICKQFNNAADAKKYMNEIKAVNALFRDYKASDYQVMTISSENFDILMIQRNVMNYKTFYAKQYK